MYHTYTEKYYEIECNTNCQALHFVNYVLGGTTTCPGPEIRRYSMAFYDSAHQRVDCRNKIVGHT